MTTSVEVRVRGVAPLLQHAFASDFENGDTARTQILQRGTPREQAESSCYRDGDKYVYFPGAAISRMIREAGANHKLKGSRRAVKFVVPSAVFVVSDTIRILDVKGKPRQDS